MKFEHLYQFFKKIDLEIFSKLLSRVATNVIVFKLPFEYFQSIQFVSLYGMISFNCWRHTSSDNYVICMISIGNK